MPDRLLGGLAGAATVGEDLLLPLDRDLERWDERDLLRGRGGEDARVAMIARLQDQPLDGRVTRRAQSGSRDAPATATDGLWGQCLCQAGSRQRWLR